MSRAMERLKKQREKDRENEPNKKEPSLFKSTKIKNLDNILEEQTGEKNIEIGGKGKSSENNNINNNLVKEESNTNINEDKIINKKKKTKKEFDG